MFKNKRKFRPSHSDCDPLERHLDSDDNEVDDKLVFTGELMSAKNVIGSMLTPSVVKDTSTTIEIALVLNQIELEFLKVKESHFGILSRFLGWRRRLSESKYQATSKAYST